MTKETHSARIPGGIGATEIFGGAFGFGDRLLLDTALSILTISLVMVLSMRRKLRNLIASLVLRVFWTRRLQRIIEIGKYRSKVQTFR
jgi:hypothetical protein